MKYRHLSTRQKLLIAFVVSLMSFSSYAATHAAANKQSSVHQQFPEVFQGAGAITPHDADTIDFSKKSSAPGADNKKADSNTYTGYGSGYSRDFAAALRGGGFFNFFAPQNQISYFTGEAFPEFLFRYRNQFAWDTMLRLFLDSTGATQTKLLFTHIDWFVNPSLTVSGGKFLSPIGKFSQTYYLPWLNKLPTVPVGFDTDGAIPRSNVGAEAYGKLFANSRVPLKYALFLLNAQRVTTSGTKMTAINSFGYPSNTSGDFTFGGRLAVLLPISDLEIGVSAADGKVGLFNASNTLVNAGRNYQVLGSDITFDWKNFNLLGEYIQQYVGGRASSTVPLSAEWEGWYAQGAYRFNPSRWETIARYSRFNTPDTTKQQKQVAFGVDYWVAPTIVAKLAYEINSGLLGTTTDANQVVFQFVFAFV